MSGKSPSQLLSQLHDSVGFHTFRRDDQSYQNSERENITNAVAGLSPSSLGGLTVESIDRQDGVRVNLAGGSWAVVRMSGTEPLLRLYAEAGSQDELNAILTDLKKSVGV